MLLPSGAIRAIHPPVIEPLTKKRPPSRPRSAEKEPATAYVFSDVLEEIRFNGQYNPRQFAGGLLAGRHYKCDERGSSYVEITGFVAGTHCPDVSSFINYLRVQWKSAGASLRYHFPEDEVVGWYLAASEKLSNEHSEQMNQDVYMLHNTFLQQPWQIGLWVGGEQAPVALTRANGRLHPNEAAIIRSPA